MAVRQSGEPKEPQKQEGDIEMDCPDCGAKMEYWALVDGTNWFVCEDCAVVIQQKGSVKRIYDREDGPLMALRTTFVKGKEMREVS